MVGIYKITNNLNGKIYVGQSINILERWYQHRYKATDPNEAGYNSAIHQAFRKYGVSNFSFEIIEECDVSLLDEREQYWIQKLHCLVPNGYNILEGGQKVRALPHVCEICGTEVYRGSRFCAACYTKQHITTAHITDAKQLALDIYKFGFAEVARQNNTTRNAIKKTCVRLGIPDTKEKIKCWLLQEQLIEQPIKKKQTRAVYQLDITGGHIIQTFNSINDAARSLGCSKGNHITEACQGKIATAYGYKWKYAD